MNTTDLIAHLERRGHDVHGYGPWRARCPAHNGQSSNSLAIAERNGRTLLHCFAGCPTESILSAVGLRWPDLFDGDRTVARTGGARTSTTAIRGGARTPTAPPRLRLDDVNLILRAFEDTGLTWRATRSPDVWRCECPICRDPWLSIRVVDIARTEGREGEPTLAFCANGCDRRKIAAALRRAA